MNCDGIHSKLLIYVYILYMYMYMLSRHTHFLIFSKNRFNIFLSFCFYVFTSIWCKGYRRKSLCWERRWGLRTSSHVLRSRVRCVPGLHRFCNLIPNFVNCTCPVWVYFKYYFIKKTYVTVKDKTYVTVKDKKKY